MASELDTRLGSLNTTRGLFAPFQWSDAFKRLSSDFCGAPMWISMHLPEHLSEHPLLPDKKPIGEIGDLSFWIIANRLLCNYLWTTSTSSKCFGLPKWKRGHLCNFMADTLRSINQSDLKDSFGIYIWIYLSAVCWIGRFDNIEAPPKSPGDPRKFRSKFKSMCPTIWLTLWNCAAW